MHWTFGDIYEKHSYVYCSAGQVAGSWQERNTYFPTATFIIICRWYWLKYYILPCFNL